MRRRLARRARPHRPRQRHLGAVAALQSRTQPRRAGLALPTRTLPIAPRPRRHRGHHRRLLPSMDRPHRRTGSYANPLRLSMDHEGDFIGSLVLSHPMGDDRLWRWAGVPSATYGPRGYNVGGADEYITVRTHWHRQDPCDRRSNVSDSLVGVRSTTSRATGSKRRRA